jgi:tRNA A-37 threonylcarbamoyl transferase component Bud32
MDDWSTPRELTSLTSAELEEPGVVFAIGDALYRTTGERVGAGGQGTVHHLDMRVPGAPRELRAVAKLYRWELLLTLRNDPTARRFFEHGRLALGRLRTLRHLHLLPVLGAEPIADNLLVVTPLAGEALVGLVLQDQLSPLERVQLLTGAVRGLRAMHEAGLVHGDFTLRNILVHTKREERRNALLFDYDLTLALDELAGASYASYYQGRIVGAPEYSLTPEQIDPVLEQLPIGPARDVYAVGTALFGLFSDASIYGDAADLPSLLEAIGEGVVRGGQSKVPYPDEMPPALREVCDTCLQRDPAARYPDASTLIQALERAQSALAVGGKGKFRSTLGYVQLERRRGLAEVFAERVEDSVGFEELSAAQAALARYGYVLDKSLGRVKGHAIHVAAPDPTLLATGRFPDSNAYRKLVTVIDLSRRADAEAYVATWLERILPVLQSVRRDVLTVLHKVVYDRPSGFLLLFSEYLDDARFGTDLVRHALTLEEALGLGIIVAAQIARLHEHGLAHNNVTLRSLLFKHLPDSGQVKPMFVGLVEPRFDEAAMVEDVRRLGGLVLALVRRSRIDEVAPAERPRLEELVGWLQALERGEGVAPTIGQLLDLLQQGLARIEPNFAVVRRHGGDVLAFAHLLTRHALHRYLWGTAVGPRGTGQGTSQPLAD